VNNQIDNLDTELHEHLEIDHGEVTTYVNVFDAAQDYVHIIFGKTDNLGKITFNKSEMFLTKEQFSELSNFLYAAERKSSARERAAMIESWRTEWLEQADKQESLIDDVDNDHIDMVRPNLIRNIQDSAEIKTKMRTSKNYCKRFYSTLCNNELAFGTYETSYSWRATGGLISEILGEGDYMNWYCSGGEGNIDEEVRADLLAIGWQVIPYDVDELRDHYTKQVLI
jgi:hypothetical protein